MNQPMSPQEEAMIAAMMGAPQAQVQQPRHRQQGGGQQQPRPQQQGGNKMKSAKYKKPIGDVVLAPVEWFAKSASWLTGHGSRFVFYGLSGACLFLSVETVYTAMPPSPSAIAQGIENRHFLPKPAIQDDADILLIDPRPVIGAVVKWTANKTIGLLPFYPQHEIAPRWTVWADPGFYLAACIALAIQATEAIAWRRLGKRWDTKLAKFNELNGRKVPDLNPNAVVAARVARAELATEGSGGYVGTGLVIFAVYLVEFFTFTRSVADAANTVPGLTIVIYGLVNIVGFELCLNMAQTPNDQD